MPDLIFLGSNSVGERVYEWLTDGDDDVLALLTERAQLSLVHELEPDFLVSAGFRHIVPEDVLDVPDRGAINLHLSYLPYNRGMNPNVWSIVEGSTAGTSIHFMTPGLDEGPIIDRERVDVTPADTGKSLYERLCDTQVQQFKRVWPSIRDGTVSAAEQDTNEGSYHHKSEFVDLWEIDRDETVTAGEFIDRLRACTFPPFQNAYFEVDDQRYYVEIDITPESEDDVSEDTQIPAYQDER